jgi:hypoxanthine phosphoribosyltransferase
MISFSELKENYYLRNYHPIRLQGEENPYFDDWSENLLLLKTKTPNLVDFWYTEIEQHLKNESFAIAVVPSSSSENKISGIHLVAQKIAKSRQITITDATSCLRRYRSIDKLALGGSRELATHTSSIEVINSHLIKNKNVLLVDDISTTGNSLRACKELLLKAGARKVKCVALGKTVTYHPENNLEAFAELAYEEIERAIASAHAQINMDAAYAHEMVEEDAANAHAQIEMDAECEHEKVEEDAANTHCSIDMNAAYHHEMLEEDTANAYYSIDMAAECEHEQAEEDAAHAHYSIDMAAVYEHEQVEKDAAHAHYSIDMAAVYEHEQVEEDAAYALAQVDVGADYAHLELEFLLAK